MKDEDIKKIGEEFVRVLNPVYEQLDKIEATLGKHSQVLEEHTDKIDALSKEMHEMHLKVGTNKDITEFEIEKIKDYIGLSSANS